MRAVYSGDIIQGYHPAAAYGIRHDRAIKISREEAPTHSRSLTPTLVFCFVSSEDSCPDSPARPHVYAHARAHACKHVRTHTRLCLHVPRGIIGSPGVDLCYQSWSPDAIPWSMACLFSDAYALRRNQVLSKWRTRPANRGLYVTHLTR